MLNSMSFNGIINALIPISRFNKGEANKIFDEVKQAGYKIVVKNNHPECVLITPERYQEMLDKIEDAYLYSEAEKRMANTTSADTVPANEVYKKYGITDSDLLDVEVEID